MLDIPVPPGQDNGDRLQGAGGGLRGDARDAVPEGRQATRGRRVCGRPTGAAGTAIPLQGTHRLVFRFD